MGFKTRQLELALSQKESELAGLRQRAEDLGAVVERYRAQESAIAGALTGAQAAAERIIRDAEQQKAGMLRSAHDARLEAEREARGIVADAERRAALIEESAKHKARETASRAEGFMADYRDNAGKLVAQFRHTAAMAMDQAKIFADYMNSLSLEGAVEIAGEYDHAAAAAKAPAQDMPDDYADPASLMRSIYAIEQRELPAEAAPEAPPAPQPAPEPAPEIGPEPAPVWEPSPAPMVKPEPAPMWEPSSAPEVGTQPAPAQEPQPAPERKPEPVPLWEPEPAREPFTASIRPEAEQPSWGNKAVELDKTAEGERVWTVEEIIERTSATDSNAIDDELNAIIEDVLRGS